MINFIAAVYNEEKQIGDLVHHVYPYVHNYYIIDDGSTDRTPKILEEYFLDINPLGSVDAGPIFLYRSIEHTGLPETVKAQALEWVKLGYRNDWVIMLDADERFAPGVLEEIYEFTKSPEAKNISHVWFTLDEYIDDQYAGRTFIKCRLFKAWAAHFSDSVHVADWFDGQGANFGWRVLHKKTREKQEMREKEYIETYNKLIDQGLMTPDKAQELKNMHYFIK